MSEYEGRLRKADYFVHNASLKRAQRMVQMFHYSRGGSNTGTYVHGLYRRDDWELMGVAWWIPPTKSAALSLYPQNWKGVLSLSRLVIVPDAPKNAASFLLGRSIAMIDRNLWPCLVTYADTWRGHVGTIYKATNWTENGMTKPERVYVKDGRMVSRKAGPKTRTHAEMLNLGAECVGSFSKHRFIQVCA